MVRKAQVGRAGAALALAILAMGGPAGAAWAQPHPSPRPDDEGPREAGRLAREQEERAEAQFRQGAAAALKQAAADLAKAKDIVCIRADRLESLIARLEQDAKTLHDLIELSDAYGQSFSGDGAVRTRRAQVLYAAQRLRAMRCPPPDETPRNGPQASGTPAPATPASPAAGKTPAITVTHRTTSCRRCQFVAQGLNNAADRYADAVRRGDPAAAAGFHREVDKLSRTLDACEKAGHCDILMKPSPSAPPRSPYRPLHSAPPATPH